MSVINAQAITELYHKIEKLNKACLLLAKYFDVVFYPRYIQEHEGLEEPPDLDQVLNEVKEILK